MIRVSLVISEATFAALSRAADAERHDLREQAAIMLTEGLLRRGLLENQSDPGGQAEVAYPSRTGDGVDSIINASAHPSTAGGRHARG